MSFKLQKGNSGYITVEAALILPAVFIMLLAIIITFTYMYQKALLTEIASAAAQQGAEVWRDSRKNIENGAWKEAAAEDSIYYRLFDPSIPYKEVILSQTNTVNKISNNLNDVQTIKVEKIEDKIKYMLNRGIINPRLTKIGIEYVNSIVEGKLTIVIHQEFKLPFGQVAALFNGKNTMTITGKSTALIADPAEYIRNVDFLMEYLARMKKEIDINRILDSLKSKVK